MGFGFDLMKGNSTKGSLAQEFENMRNELQEAQRQMDVTRHEMLRQQIQAKQMRASSQDMQDALRYINQGPSGLGQIQAAQAMRDSLVFGQGRAKIQWDPSQAAGIQYHYKADWAQAPLSEIDQMIAELRHRVDTFKL